MNLQIFDGPRRKVRRAKKHIEELHRSVMDFRRSGPYLAIVDPKMYPGEHVLRVVERRPPPSEWPLLLGDAIHNMRAALDILACDLMRLHNRGVASVHFPFARDPDSLESVLRDRTLHRARPDIVQTFRELRPYPNGNDLLWSIHQLDLSDKHKLLIPIVSLTSVRHVSVWRSDGHPYILNVDFTAPRLHKALIAVPAAEECRFKYDPKPAFQIFFGTGPKEEKPIFPALHQMVNLVDEIISTFEKRWLDPRPPILLGYTP